MTGSRAVSPELSSDLSGYPEKRVRDTPPRRAESKSGAPFFMKHPCAAGVVDSVPDAQILLVFNGFLLLCLNM